MSDIDYDELAAAGDDARKRKREEAMFPERQPVKTLAEEFPKEQARLRELIDAYRDIGQAGAFGLAMIRQVLARADAAAMSGDVVEMMRAYSAMKDCE